MAICWRCRSRSEGVTGSASTIGPAATLHSPPKPTISKPRRCSRVGRGSSLRSWLPRWHDTRGRRRERCRWRRHAEAAPAAVALSTMAAPVDMSTAFEGAGRLMCPRVVATRKGFSDGGSNEMRNVELFWIGVERYLTHAGTNSGGWCHLSVGTISGHPRKFSYAGSPAHEIYKVANQTETPKPYHYDE